MFLAFPNSIRHVSASPPEADTLDEAKIQQDEFYDGLWVLRTNTTLVPEIVALQYKQLWRVERIFRDTKTLLKNRPIFHKYDVTIRGHIFCSFNKL